MKSITRNFKLVFGVLAILLFINNKVSAQQCGPLGGHIEPLHEWSTFEVSSSGMSQTFDAIEGHVYSFSYCAADGGMATYNTILEIYTEDGTFVTSNDDHCGELSRIEWTATETNRYHVQTLHFGLGCTMNGVASTLAVRAVSPHIDVTFPNGNLVEAGEDLEVEVDADPAFFSPGREFQITLFDGEGSVVAQESISDLSEVVIFSTNSLLAGDYFIRVSGEDDGEEVRYSSYYQVSVSPVITIPGTFVAQRYVGNTFDLEFESFGFAEETIYTAEITPNGGDFFVMSSGSLDGIKIKIPLDVNPGGYSLRVGAPHPINGTMVYSSWESFDIEYSITIDEITQPPFFLGSDLNIKIDALVDEFPAGTTFTAKLYDNGGNYLLDLGTTTERDGTITYVIPNHFNAGAYQVRVFGSEGDTPVYPVILDLDVNDLAIRNGRVDGAQLIFDNAGLRTATTQAFDVSRGGYLHFDFRVTDAQPNEEVVLEYRVSGESSFTTFATFNVEDYQSFTTFEYNLPPDAYSTATEFRWRQKLNSGSGHDVWALRNIKFVKKGNVLGISGFDGFDVFLPSISNLDVDPAGPYFAGSEIDELSFEVLGFAENTFYTAYIADNAGMNGMISLESQELQIVDNDGTIAGRIPAHFQGGSNHFLQVIASSALPVVFPSKIIDEDFQGVTVGEVWENISGGELGSACMGAGQAMYFNGTAERKITTKALDIYDQGTISLDIQLGCTNNPNAGEEVVLEFSTDNGASFEEITKFFPADYKEMKNFTTAIPSQAVTSTTIFRIRQLKHDGENLDNWLIDNVVIEVGGNVINGNYETRAIFLELPAIALTSVYETTDLYYHGSTIELDYEMTSGDLPAGTVFYAALKQDGETIRVIGSGTANPSGTIQGVIPFVESGENYSVSVFTLRNNDVYIESNSRGLHIYNSTITVEPLEEKYQAGSPIDVDYVYTGAFPESSDIEIELYRLGNLVAITGLSSDFGSQISGDIPFGYNGIHEVGLRVTTHEVTSDDFEGDLSNWHWNTGSIKDACDGGSNAMVFENAGTRGAKSHQLNLSGGAVIEFDLGVCGDLSVGGNSTVTLEYFFNNEFWDSHTIQVFDLSEIQGRETFTIELSTAAYGSLVNLQFIQTGNGEGENAWFIDNLNINATIKTLSTNKREIEIEWPTLYIATDFEGKTYYPGEAFTMNYNVEGVLPEDVAFTAEVVVDGKTYTIGLSEVGVLEGTMVGEIPADIYLPDGFDGRANVNVYASRGLPLVKAEVLNLEVDDYSRLIGAKVDGSELEFSKAGKRMLVTKPMDLTLGASLSFDMFIPDVFERQEERILLQYTTDGSTYVDLASFSTTHWGYFVELPEEALTETTQIRWVQPVNTDADLDVWTLDDVTLTLGGNDITATYLNIVNNDQEIFIEHPTVNTTAELLTTDLLYPGSTIEVSYEVDGTLPEGSIVKLVIVDIDLDVEDYPIIGTSEELVSGVIQATIPRDQYAGDYEIRVISNTGSESNDMTIHVYNNVIILEELSHKQLTPGEPITITYSTEGVYDASARFTAVVIADELDGDGLLTGEKIIAPIGTSADLSGVIEGIVPVALIGHLGDQLIEGQDYEIRIIASENDAYIIPVSWSIESDDWKLLQGVEDASATTLRFDKAGYRSAQTRAFNLKNGGTVSFTLSGGVNKGREIVVEYSVDGGNTFVEAEVIKSSGVYSAVNLTGLENATGNEATLIRWRQIANLGSGNDVWELSNVSVSNLSNAYPNVFVSNALEVEVGLPAIELELVSTANLYAGDQAEFELRMAEGEDKVYVDGVVFKAWLKGGDIPADEPIFLGDVALGTFSVIIPENLPTDVYLVEVKPTVEVEGKTFVYKTEASDALPVFSPIITVGEISGTIYPGSEIEVPFQVTSGGYASGTAFTAFLVELEFTGIVEDEVERTPIGSISALAPSITATIPMDIVPGENYKIVVYPSHALPAINPDEALIKEYDNRSDVTGIDPAIDQKDDLTLMTFDQKGTRSLTTIDLDAREGSHLDFHIRIIDADKGEDVVVEYSVDNGATYETLQVFDAVELSKKDWEHFKVYIPTDAKTVSTRFRFRQVINTGLNEDVWQIFDPKFIVGGNLLPVANMARYIDIYAPTVTFVPILTNVCAGDQVELDFVAIGNFYEDNVFLAQLSDEEGNFEPVAIDDVIDLMDSKFLEDWRIIGSIEARGAGTIAINVPSNLVKGEKYRLRLIAANADLEEPKDGEVVVRVIGSKNVENIVIVPTPDLELSKVVTSEFEDICIGASVSIVVDAQPGVTYQLRNDADNSFVGQAVKATGATVSLPTGQLAETSYFNVLATSACHELQLASRIEVLIQEIPQIEAWGDVFEFENALTEGVIVCEGEGLWLSVPAGIGPYTWYRDNVKTGAATSWINVTRSGSYHVVAEGLGNCPINSDPVNVTVVAPPQRVDITYEGELRICEGGAPLVLSAPVGYAQYAWFLNGQNLNSEHPSSTIEASAAGAYTVRVYNEQLCESPASKPVVLVVAPLPNDQLWLSVNGNDICYNQSTQINVDPTQANVSYQLVNLATGANVGEPVIGNRQSIFLTTGPLAATTRLAVRATNLSSECSAMTDGSVQVMVRELATISVNANVLTASKGSSYLWFRNGILIPNETGRTITVYTSGNYKVVVTYDNDCVSESNAVPFSITDLENAIESTSLTLYPNPVENGELHLSLLSNEFGEVEVSIYDVTGKVHLNKSFAKNNVAEEKSFDISHINQGIYWVKVVQSGKVSIHKVVKR
jgi:hypothetical protein